MTSGFFACMHSCYNEGYVYALTCVFLSKYKEEDDTKKMILISKEEKEKISKRFPNIHITRTMKQKSKRHKYYCEEGRAVLKYLEELRTERIVADV